MGVWDDEFELFYDRFPGMGVWIVAEAEYSLYDLWYLAGRDAYGKNWHLLICHLGDRRVGRSEIWRIVLANRNIVELIWQATHRIQL